MLGRRKENLVYTVRACAEFPWYPAYYMYSNVWSVSVYLLKGRSAGLYILPMRLIRTVLKSEILGELGMLKQYVSGSFSSAQAQEPENKASVTHNLE